jgi:hypothetical protein
MIDIIYGIIFLILISYIYRIIRIIIIHRNKKRHNRRNPPLANKLTLTEINNNNIILKGKIMSISLVGKQRVTGKISPLDSNGNIIDVSLYPPGAIIQSGTYTVISSDPNIITVEVDTVNPFGVIVTSLGVEGTATVGFGGLNADGNSVLGQDDVIVTLPETTSTSTSTTTTLSQEIPLAATFKVDWGTPEDIS